MIGYNSREEEPENSSQNLIPANFASKKHS
jgi:hypothetical protein